MPLLVLAGCLVSPRSGEIPVDFSGKIVNAAGAGVSGARIDLLESDLSATSGADGTFRLSGNFTLGAVRRAVLPGGARLEVRGGRLSLWNPGLDLHVTFVTPLGRTDRMAAGGSGGKAWLDLDGRLESRPAAGLYFIRVESAAGSATFRYLRKPGGQSRLLAGISGGEAPPPSAEAGAAPPAAKTAAGPDRFVLRVSAAGFLAKSYARPAAQDSNLALALLASTASLKERIQDFLGPDRTFRLAFLKKDGAPSGKPALHYLDFAEMSGDSMPLHAFPDSRLDNLPVEAFAPSWSPDGRTLAYEAGFEGVTTPTSRIFIQPLQGARRDGPGSTATNPRWHVAGSDTLLIWCASGAKRAWNDTTGWTFRQRFSGGQLVGQKEMIVKGSYNGGLSPDGRYLATAIPWGLMLDAESGEKRFLHLYPGHSQGKPGANSDTLQVCNASISADPAHPSRMLFLDFGVPDGETAYPNSVKPQHYAQHRMILVGDYLSDAPGRIVDFIDTPEAELAAQKTWDDPEWSNLPDFAVATTRDPNGDLSDPLSPRQTQPDIYLIKLSTRESLKVYSGAHQTLPVLWIGPKQ